MDCHIHIRRNEKRLWHRLVERKQGFPFSGLPERTDISAVRSLVFLIWPDWELFWGLASCLAIGRSFMYLWDTGDGGWKKKDCAGRDPALLFCRTDALGGAWYKSGDFAAHRWDRCRICRVATALCVAVWGKNGYGRCPAFRGDGHDGGVALYFASFVCCNGIIVYI